MLSPGNFQGLPASAYGLGPAVNRKLPSCLLSQLPKIFEVRPDEMLSFWTGDFHCYPCGIIMQHCDVSDDVE